MRRHNDRLLPILALAGAALALAGCGDSLNKQLGLGKNPPDEFRVVERAPLAIPPRFQLRPPQPGAERPQETTPRQQAETAVFTQEDEEGAAAGSFEEQPGLSEGERTLLARAGADQAPADIRQVVNREARKVREANEALLSGLLFWQEERLPGDVVDAEAEAARIRENQALGEDVTEGETPTIERGERGALEGLF